MAGRGIELPAMPVGGWQDFAPARGHGIMSTPDRSGKHQPMVERDALSDHLDELLEVHRFSDYCPNGLQVEGRRSIELVIGGVTACQALLDAAVARQADAVLVHHGYFWRGEDARVVGMKARRLHTLLSAGLNLFAYHLPLDAHPQLGNNAQLGRRLGIVDAEPAESPADSGLLWTGRLQPAGSAASLAQRLAEVLGREPLHVGEPEAPLERIAWCTGAAQSMIEEAAGLAVDAYISGEISEPTAHVARERGLHYFAAGHHATERDGVRALGSHLAQRFGIRFEFVDIPNPA
jgi:dinuclear metal center YbgI/SA1388 family protein